MAEHSSSAAFLLVYSSKERPNSVPSNEEGPCKGWNAQGVFVTFAFIVYTGKVESLSKIFFLRNFLVDCKMKLDT